MLERERAREREHKKERQRETELIAVGHRDNDFFMDAVKSNVPGILVLLLRGNTETSL